MKKLWSFVAFFLIVASPCLYAQETTSPCTSCAKYYYWTGEVDEDFFNERNWRVAVQLPSSPTTPTEASNGPVKPHCLPGANKEAHQICLTQPDLAKDKIPQPGSIDPGTPIKYNLYAHKASIEINGDVLFESDQIGFTADGLSLNIHGKLLNGIWTISGESTLRVNQPGSLGQNTILDLNDALSWIYFYNSTPDETSSSLNAFRSNGEPATVDGNLRINQYYQKGSVVRMKDAAHAPLTIFNASNTSASLQEHIIYAGNGIPLNFDNETNSFVLKRGYMATFAVNENGTGKSKVYIASEEDLLVDELPLALQNNISFIRVLPWNWVAKKGNGGFKPGVDAAWFYNWNNNQTSKPNYEYVPMTWGASAALPPVLNQIIAKEKVTHLLGFNESDNCNDQSGQFANLCKIDVAVAYYENLMGTGLRLGTPAPRENGPTGWLCDFARVAKERDVRFDFVAVHWYDWGSNPANSPYEDAQKVFNRFKTYLANVYSIYGLPIWITEFNANPNRDNAVNAEFLSLALPYLEQLDYVERYAYFEPMSIYASTNVNPSPLFDSLGNITNIGTIYRDQVSTPSISEPTYSGVNNLSGMDLPYVDPVSQSLEIEAECTNYKGNRWQVKEDSLASNHFYLQHNSSLEGASGLADQFHYEFENTKAEVYRIWIRMKSNPGTNGSIRLKIDNAAFESIPGLTSTTFAWLRVPRYIPVGPGKHRLSIANVNDGTLIDKIVLINTSNAIDIAADTTHSACALPRKDWGLVATDVIYWAEAESASAGSEWQQGNDGSAIGQKFMEPIGGVSALDLPPGSAGHLSFQFEITADDEYNVWGKVQSPTNNSDAFWFSVDGEPFRKWDNLESRVYQWNWQKFHFSEPNSDRLFSYFLEAGNHTVVVAYSEAGAKIDRLAIASTHRDPAVDDPNVLKRDPVLEFEAETATLLGTPTVVNCSVASNGKLVNISGNVNNIVRFSDVGIANAGNYRLTISYISKDTRNFKLTVNGVDLGGPSNYSVISSGNWCFEANPITAEWHKVIALNAGSNTIDIKTISTNNNTNAPFIDKISLAREFRSYEAEQANLTGASIENCTRASNGQLVNLGLSTSNAIVFSNVDVDESATYYVDIHYVSKVVRNARITINGVVETVSFEASGNWCFESGPSNSPKVKSLQRQLVAGTNTIEIRTTGADAPLIDKISIVKQPVRIESNARRSYEEYTQIAESKPEEQMLFPNPLLQNGELSVYVPGNKDGNFELRLMDLNGRPVFPLVRGKMNETLKVRPELKTGLYIIVIDYSSRRDLHKLIVK